MKTLKYQRNTKLWQLYAKGIYQTDGELKAKLSGIDFINFEYNIKQLQNDAHLIGSSKQIVKIALSEYKNPKGN